VQLEAFPEHPWQGAPVRNELWTRVDTLGSREVKAHLQRRKVTPRRMRQQDFLDDGSAQRLADE
jgi:hypothetical protein